MQAWAALLLDELGGAEACPYTRVLLVCISNGICI
jgi:hypothetical protein